jgi:ABC-type sugar transport system permease subunit
MQKVETSKKKLSLSSYPWGVWVVICTTLSVSVGLLCGFLFQRYIQDPFLGLFSLGFFFGFVMVGMICMFIFAAMMGRERTERERKEPRVRQAGK